jgi:hypothetical protein
MHEEVTIIIVHGIIESSAAAARPRLLPAALQCCVIRHFYCIVRAFILPFLMLFFAVVLGSPLCRRAYLINSWRRRPRF